MKEVYRSFEGVLSAGESGYRVVELEDYFEINDISTLTRVPDVSVRVSKDYASGIDWTDGAKIGEIEIGVKDGKIPGQYFYNGKWYSTELIHKIQNQHKDYLWMNYV